MKFIVTGFLLFVALGWPCQSARQSRKLSSVASVASDNSECFHLGCNARVMKSASSILRRDIPWSVLDCFLCARLRLRISQLASSRRMALGIVVRLDDRLDLLRSWIFRDSLSRWAVRLRGQSAVCMRVRFAAMRFEFVDPSQSRSVSARGLVCSSDAWAGQRTYSGGTLSRLICSE